MERGVAGETAQLMTVAEASRRTGLTRAALRLYEKLGLVCPVGRTEGGYRLYDDEALRRMNLVCRAKLLGLTLAETEEFIRVAGGCCGESQPGLAELVERKIRETEQRIQELTELSRRLQALLGGQHATDGDGDTGGNPRRCEGLCGCDPDRSSSHDAAPAHSSLVEAVL